MVLRDVTYSTLKMLTNHGSQINVINANWIMIADVVFPEAKHPVLLFNYTLFGIILSILNNNRLLAFCRIQLRIDATA